MKLYDQNPTIDFLAQAEKPLDDKQNEDTHAHDETRQGEVFFVGTPKAEKYFYIESYGCAMNFADSEIVASILLEIGYAPTRIMEEADLFLINTCSIREKAEATVRKRLELFAKYKRQRKGLMVGVLGCMAERLKQKLVEEDKLVDIVVGPDAYRDLPNLLNRADEGNRSVNVLLSREETYSDIAPVRLVTNGVSAFVSIMRGCDNMCSFCVVPFTRGRERSRDAFSIIAEASDLFQKGYREVTLLGQNVDSYKWDNPATQTTVTFADLLEMTALINPLLRVRFSTSHPKDITDGVLFTIAKYKNICNYIHLPVQSGNSRVLELMNRTYTREWYMERVARIYELMPDCAISSDIICGFCTETEEDHADTLSIIEYSRFTLAYQYIYSERPGTLAARKYADDITAETKQRRLEEVIEVQNRVSLEGNKLDIGNTFEVLIDGDSKRSAAHWAGRTSQNKVCIFEKTPDDGLAAGSYTTVLIHDCTKATLFGTMVTI